ncbi:Fe-S oxidoreductase [Methanocella conradii HZ254]|uniref:Fe-S oxidoreductase n=1 Tax=Methanocella conradii (strain DSM 24694 / JCM 17849 / CGMCC 1.5162 / HZ254) TaxID=1041930 RepID=H8I5F7_METCZ|nr:heterodisulfide reductase-related iron-sulfur binding cluster [Methanocella conradii]AFC98851.1 Fe-S oxidoreductase [Methanocella conradii HZ254]
MSGIQRKLALFAALLLFLAGILTMVPDEWLLGPQAACHTCHEAQYPASHLLYRINYMGYNSLCSFAPFSTLILVGAAILIFLTTFKIKFERWGPQYRVLAVAALVALAIMTMLPIRTGYRDLLGMSTLDPLAPLSTLFLLALALAASMGFIVCPFLIIMRCRCPVLEKEMDASYAPDRAILRYLKIALTGRLSDEDVRRLYMCTLCNGCWLSWFNRHTRAMAVKKGIVPSHLASIRGSMEKYGNPYGTALEADGGNAINGKADTLLFRGCTARLKAPEILSAAQLLLDKKGIKYGLIDESCCGYTLINLGDLDAGLKAVDRNIAAFKAAGVRRIITVCPGCYAAFNRYYKGRGGFDPEVVLALDLLKEMRVPAKGVTVHDPCHARDKRELARSVLVGAREDGTGACCGAGGGVMSFDRALAGHRANRIFEENLGSVVTYCPFCYLNLSRTCSERVSDIYVLLAKGGIK